jgi:glycosyltransferase involved in cell wall biosynthesis
MAPDLVPFPKGSGVRIEATVRALQRAGAQVTLATPAAAADGPVLSDVDHRLVVVPGAGNFLDRMLEWRRQTSALAGSQKWDVIWFRSPWEGTSVRSAAAAAKVVYEAHGFPSMELPYHFPALLGRPDVIAKMIDEENRLLRRADVVLTPSETGRSFLWMRGVTPERVAVVPNAVDTERFGLAAGFGAGAGTASGAGAAAGAIAASAGPLRVIYLGTLAPWQGIGTLLEALALLRGRVDLSVSLVGTRKGTWIRGLKRIATDLRVRRYLRVPGAAPPADVPDVLAAADVCVAPLPDDARNSVQGCCPIKLLEYMAAGRPILSTRIRPVLEMLTDGHDAHLVRPGSAHALARGLMWLATHREEAEALGRNARETARQRFAPARFDARLAAVLRRLAQP